MFDPNKLLGQLMGSSAGQGFAGGLAGGLLGGALTSKKGRKMGKKAMQYGAIATLGGLAYAAYREHQGKQAQLQAPQQPSADQAVVEAPPADSGFLPQPDDVEANHTLGMTLVRAMIAAARADGKLDAEESQAIFGQIQETDLTAEEKAKLLDELQKPADLEAIVAAVTTPQEAMEVYLASLMAIEADTPAERAYLSLLAARLELDEDLVRELHAQAEAV